MANTTTFRNWNNSASSTPQAVAVPQNLEELIDVVKDTVRSSYGLFGPIFEVTFRIQRQSVLAYSHESFKLTSLPSRERLFGGADGVLGFSLPYSDRIVVERRRILGETAP